MRNLILLMTLLTFAACSNPAVQEELDKVKAELAKTKSSVEDLTAQIEEEGALIHIVFFKLKPEADANALVAEVKKLEAIEVVKDLQVGPFQDLGDARALSDYSMLLEMSFDDVAAYKKYQEHPIHLTLKENLKSFMAGPPATYDYLKK